MLSREIMIIFYYGLLHSIISYGIIAWGGAYPTQKIILQNLQNKVLKIINKNQFITENFPYNLDQYLALTTSL